MSLRMNLYGWSFDAFVEVLGSGDEGVLKTATELLAEAITDPAARSRGEAWLKTLIESGAPLAKERKRSPAPDDGGLLTMHMETEPHVFAVHSIVEAIARDDYLDLAEESINWTHSAASALHGELASLGFSRPTGDDPKRWFMDYIRWISGLTSGTPLFGDDFRSQWAFYSYFQNRDLAAMIPVLQLAKDFQKRLPDDTPDEVRRAYKTSLSAGGQEFVAALTTWFGRIQQAGQDAFILWW